jgi:DNA mismatch repair ATPase MutS
MTRSVDGSCVHTKNVPLKRSHFSSSKVSGTLLQDKVESNAEYSSEDFTRIVQSENESLDVKEIDTNCIICIVQGSGPGCEIGFASIEFDRMECQIGHFSDTLSYSFLCAQISKLSPGVLVIGGRGTMNDSRTSASIVPEELLAAISKSFPGLEIRILPRSILDAKLGVSIIREFRVRRAEDNHNESTQNGFEESNFYMLAAISGLFSFVDKCGGDAKRAIHAKNMIRFKNVVENQRMFIDHNSNKSLELTTSNCISDSSESGNLFGGGALSVFLASGCTSALGRRRIRSDVHSPLTEEGEILLRQELIQNLISYRGGCEENWEQLRMHLGRFGDIQAKLATLLRPPSKRDRGSQRLAALMAILRSLLAAENIESVLECIGGGLSAKIKSTLQESNISMLRDQLRCAIEYPEDDCESPSKKELNNYQLCYSVRAVEPDGTLLEVARRALEETTDDIVGYCGELLRDSSGTPLEGSKVRYCNSIGGFILSRSGSSKARTCTRPLPAVIHNVGTLGWSTVTLEKLNERIREAMEEIGQLTMDIVDDLCAKVFEASVSLHSLADMIGVLDSMISLATIAIQWDCIVPQISTDGSTVVLDAKSPMIAGTARPVSYSISPIQRMVVLTGPNMSGKTSILRLAATIQVLFQIGGFVPAKQAQISIVSCIMARMGSDDDVLSGASSFFVEMRDSAAMIAKSTANNEHHEVICDENSLGTTKSLKSMFLIDELGRGTSTHEGESLSTAIAESLLYSASCSIFFVTHFSRVASYLSTFPAVRHMKLDDEVEERAMLPQTLENMDSGKSLRPPSYRRLIARHPGLSLAEKILQSDSILLRNAQSVISEMDQVGSQNEHLWRAHQRAAERRRLVIRTAYRVKKIIDGGEAEATCDGSTIEKLLAIGAAFLEELENI